MVPSAQANRVPSREVAASSYESEASSYGSGASSYGGRCPPPDPPERESREGKRLLRFHCLVHYDPCVGAVGVTGTAGDVVGADCAGA
jgi:hypothetical protein